MMGVQEQVRRISDKDVLVAVLEKGSVSTRLPTHSSLLIRGVKGQSGVGSPSTKLVVMWLASVLFLPMVAKRLRLPYIRMVLEVALSSDRSHGFLASGGPTHDVPIAIAKLVSIACCG